MTTPRPVTHGPGALTHFDFFNIQRPELKSTKISVYFQMDSCAESRAITLFYHNFKFYQALTLGY